jgi:hypothetical protein
VVLVIEASAIAVNFVIIFVFFFKLDVAGIEGSEIMEYLMKLLLNYLKLMLIL